MPVRNLPKKPMADINVVPYIDVMLVLLIIFMVTAPLLKQGVDVKLPQASSHTLKSPKLSPLIITIDKAGYYYLNIGPHSKRPIAPQTLVYQVLQAVNLHGQKRPVFVKGDCEVRYGKVVEAMALLQKKGITQIGLITVEPPAVTRPVKY